MSARIIDTDAVIREVFGIQAEGYKASQKLFYAMNAELVPLAATLNDMMKDSFVGADDALAPSIAVITDSRVSRISLFTRSESRTKSKRFDETESVVCLVSFDSKTNTPSIGAWNDDVVGELKRHCAALLLAEGPHEQDEAIQKILNVLASGMAYYVQKEGLVGAKQAATTIDKNGLETPRP